MPFYYIKLYKMSYGRHFVHVWEQTCGDIRISSLMAAQAQGSHIVAEVAWALVVSQWQGKISPYSTLVFLA